MRPIRTLILLPALLLAGCGGDGDGGSAGPSTAPPTPPATTSIPTSAVPSAPEIRAGDFAFSPRTLTVAAGTTVTVTNTGQAPHTWTAKAGQPVTFDVEMNERGNRGQFTFATAGTYEYVCTIHEAQGMVGTVVVT